MVKSCPNCQTEKEDYLFYTHKKNKSGLSSWCQSCIRAKAKIAYDKDPGLQRRMRATNILWRENNRFWCRFRHILNTYHLTLDQYYALEESQDFVCAVCKEDCELHVDHNHSTQKVRGLLCMGCNMGLGNFKDNLVKMQQAIEYLVKRGSYAPL